MEGGQRGGRDALRQPAGRRRLANSYVELVVSSSKTLVEKSRRRDYRSGAFRVARVFSWGARCEPGEVHRDQGSSRDLFASAGNRKFSSPARRRCGRASFLPETGRRPGGPPPWKARCAVATRLRSASRGWRDGATPPSWCPTCRPRDSCAYLAEAEAGYKAGEPLCLDNSIQVKSGGQECPPYTKLSVLIVWRCCGFRATASDRSTIPPGSKLLDCTHSRGVCLYQDVVEPGITFATNGLRLVVVAKV